MVCVSETINTKDLSYLRNFAFCGTTDGYKQMIDYLARIAENEVWSFDNSPNKILIKYINGTFRQCYNQNKIMYSDDNLNACFNTGLLTPNGNDIIGLFVKNERQDSQLWYLKGFRDKTEK